VLVLLLLALFIHVRQNDRRNVLSRTNEEPYSITVPHSDSITNSAFSVAASSSKYVKFQIRPEATEIKLDGHFSATGGMGNDVEVYVLDEDGFVNSQNGHSAATYYNSGKVTQANITATLPGPGTYYLFFNNKFSLMTPKAVVANATVHYNTVERR